MKWRTRESRFKGSIRCWMDGCMEPFTWRTIGDNLDMTAAFVIVGKATFKINFLLVYLISRGRLQRLSAQISYAAPNKFP
jgi:hypothetical protein